MSVIDLSKLPPPAVIEEVSYDDLLQEMLDKMLELNPGYHLQPTDPAYKALAVAAVFRVIDRQKTNDRARSLMLAFTSGSTLDHIGVTYYGTERLDGETDESYLERLQLAYGSPSTAGGVEAYRYYARQASPLVKDARPHNGGACVVNVPVLSSEGDGGGDSNLAEVVRLALTPQKVRPLNDNLNVYPATIKKYQLKAVLTVLPGPDRETVRAEALRAAKAYTEARHRLGETMFYDKLRATLYVEGVEHVDMEAPTSDIACTLSEAPFCESYEVEVNVT